MKNKILISQSLYKAWIKYKKPIKTYKDGVEIIEKEKNPELCGLLFKAQYIDKTVESIPSEAMKEGIYFEYLATGSLPKSGEVPYPEKTAKGELKEPYKRIEEAVKFFKAIVSHFNIKILKCGYTLLDDEKSGVLDILAEWNGKKCIIDLKYSGMINDKWSDFGWDIEALPKKFNLLIQGLHYKILAEDILGIKNIPFYYFVFNSKNPTDVKIIEQIVDVDAFDIHRKDIKLLLSKLEEEEIKGYKAYPSYSNCKDCINKLNCSERILFPPIDTVFFNPYEA